MYSGVLVNPGAEAFLKRGDKADRINKKYFLFKNRIRIFFFAGISINFISSKQKISFLIFHYVAVAAYGK